MSWIHRAALLALLAATVELTVAGEDARMADLGTCATEDGATVLECRVSYRVFGTLNAARDNAVLVPTWYGGTSADLQRLLDREAMIDTTRFFVILVDALGNGVSTSPSNSREQPAEQFPAITIRDMVAAQHRLVTEHLGLPRLHAVVGYSMGAMQALEWAVRYPDAVRRVVALQGTPKATTHDRVTWRALRRMVDQATAGVLPGDSAWLPMSEFWQVIRSTPDHVNGIAAEDLDAVLLRGAAAWQDFSAWDNRLQLGALLRHDVGAHFRGGLEQAAHVVTASMLLVVSPEDRVVGPQPARRFAELAGAELMSVPSACGHFATFCDPSIAERVRSFLGEPGRSPQKVRSDGGKS